VTSAKPRRFVVRSVCSLVAAGLAFAIVVPASATSPQKKARTSARAARSAREDVRAARAELRSLDIQLSLAAERLHEGKVLLATLRGQLSFARTRSDRADVAATDAVTAFDSLVRWSYESGVSSQIGVLGLGSVSDLEEGVGLLSAMAEHQRAVVASAAGARAAAARADGQTTSLEAEVAGELASQRTANRDLNAAAVRQRTVIAHLEHRLHRKIQLAVADRHAAEVAAQQPPPPPPAPPAPAPGSTSGPAPGPTSGPLPGPSEPQPTTGEIVDLITSLWGTGYDGQVARCVAWRESRYQPTARNTSSGASGLFQLMPFWWDGNNQYGWRFDPYDPRQNAIHAHLIWKADGWGPWTTGHLCV
jgi:hypothetical protein